MGDPMARAEAMLEASNARMFESLEVKVFETEGQLKETEKQKHELAVSMFALQNEVKRLTHKLSSTETKAARLEKDNANLRTHQTQLEGTKDAVEKKRLKLQREADSMRIELQKQHAHIETLMEASRTLNVGLKAHKMSEASSLKQIELLELQMAEERRSKEQLFKEMEKLQGSKAYVEEQLRLQEHETKIAQRELEKVVDEIQILSASKNVLQQQWQQSLVAMSKRDAVLDAAEKKRKEAEDKLHHELADSGGTVSVIRDLKQENIQEKQQRRQAQNSLSFLQNQHGTLLKKNKQLEEALQREVVNNRKLENNVTGALSSSAKFELLLLNETRAKQEVEDRLKAKDSQIQELQTKVTTANRETDVERQRTSQSMADGEKRLESLEVNKSNTLNRQALEITQLRHEIDRLKQVAKDAESMAVSIQEERDKLAEAGRHWEMASLRQGITINKLQDEVNQFKLEQYEKIKAQSKNKLKKNKAGQEDEIDPYRKMQNLEESLSKAQKVIKAQSQELSVLRIQWSQAEGKMIKANQEIALLKPKAAAVTSNTELLSHLQCKSRKIATRLEKQLDETNVRLNTTRIQQRRTNEEKNAVLKQNQVLTYRLTDNSLQMEESKHLLQAEISTLKANLNASLRSNHDVVKQQFEAESGRIILSGRHELLGKRYEAAQTRVRELEQENASLKLKVNKLTTETTSLSKQTYKLKRDLSHALGRSAALKTSKKHTPNTSEALIKGEGVSNNQLYQLRADLLKAETKIATMDEEGSKREARLLREKSRSERLGKAYLERDQLARDLNVQLASCKALLESASARGERAFSIAIALESQLMQVSEPGMYIKYEINTEAEPSKYLIAALENKPATPHNGGTSPRALSRGATPTRPKRGSTSSRPGSSARPGSSSKRNFIRPPSETGEPATGDQQQ